MFSFFRSKKKNNSTPQHIGFKTDVHSHILPGIDDGSDSVEESIELIEGLIEIGINKSITTPHVTEGVFPNTIKEISIANDQLQKAIKEKQIEFDLRFSAEYRLDEDFEKIFANNQIIPFPKKYILIENSFFQQYWMLEDIIFRLNVNGFHPILAHPERYSYYQSDYSIFERLQELHCKFQVNILSFAGIYGKEVKQVCNHLLNNGMINFLATDVHHIRHINAIKEYITSSEYQKIISKLDLLNDTLISE